MRIKSFTFSNIRSFDGSRHAINFSEDKNVTILLGDNNVGKTTILDSLSIVLSAFTSQFPEGNSKSFDDKDVHVSTLYPAPFLSTSTVISLADSDIEVKMFHKGLDKAPSSVLKDIKEHANKLKNQVVEGAKVTLPILAYYGTERGQITPPETRRNFSKRDFTRLFCYSGSMESSANFKRFFTWFNNMEDEERRERESRYQEVKDSANPQDIRTAMDYRHPVLEAVRLALSKLETGFSNPRIKTRPLRFVMDETCGEDVREVRIERMSDGYRIMFAMVADIASRVAEANFDPAFPCSAADLLDTPGVVLIDEIDLHLHPKWQRNVIAQLSSIFKNVQFIVSTHSPSVILGSLDIAEVVRLSDGGVRQYRSLEQFMRYDVSLLLLSDLFGIENVRSDGYAAQYNRYRELLKNNNPSPEERQELMNIQRDLLLYRTSK